jgi:hypothetical protein
MIFDPHERPDFLQSNQASKEQTVSHPAGM